jgi:hypothetical protein
LFCCSTPLTDILCSDDDKCKSLIEPELICVVFGTFNVPIFQVPDINDDGNGLFDPCSLDPTALLLLT